IHPDVDHVIGMAGERDPPTDGCARDGEILETLFDERHDLVHARRRINEVRIPAVVLEQRLGVAAQFEEEIALGGHLDGMSAFVFAVAYLILGDERLLALAVPAGVLAEVNVVRNPLLNAADQLQHAEAVALLGGADEIVVADVELAPHLVMLGHDAVGQLDGQDSFLRRGALDLLPMLVGAGQEPDVVAHPPAMPRDDVRDDVLVHVSDVRIVIDVMDGGSDVELVHRERGGIVARLLSPVCVASRQGTELSFTIPEGRQDMCYARRGVLAFALCLSASIALPSFAATLRPRTESRGTITQSKSIHSEAAGIFFSGSFSYAIGSGQATLKADNVTNPNATASGPLRFSLWFTALPYPSAGFSTASYDITPSLAAGQSITGVNGGNTGAPFTNPPNGCYYVSLVLEENVSGTWTSRDYGTFSRSFDIGNGCITSFTASPTTVTSGATS